MLDLLQKLLTLPQTVQGSNIHLPGHSSCINLGFEDQWDKYILIHVHFYYKKYDLVDRKPHGYFKLTAACTQLSHVKHLTPNFLWSDFFFLSLGQKGNWKAEVYCFKKYWIEIPYFIVTAYLKFIFWTATLVGNFSSLMLCCQMWSTMSQTNEYL